MSGLDEFYRAGRDFYREAKTATRAFEVEMQGRLRSFLSSRKRWGPFDLSPKPSPSTGGDPANGFWISLNVRGKIDSTDTTLEFGYWWLPSAIEIDIRSVMYADCYKGPEGLMRFKYDRSDPEIRAFTWNDRTHLALPIPEDMQPGPAVNRLLDVLVKAM